MDILKVLKSDLKKYEDVLQKAPIELIDLRDVAIMNYISELIKNISSKRVDISKK